VALSTQRAIAKNGHPLGLLPGGEENGELVMLQYAALVNEASEVTPRCTAKPEAPPIVVDALGKGDYSSIKDAVSDASPGDRILTRPGRYIESVLIDKPLEILGDGMNTEIVWEATGTSVLVFRASMGRVANLSIRQGGGDGYGVEVVQGRLIL